VAILRDACRRWSDDRLLRMRAECMASLRKTQTSWWATI